MARRRGCKGGILASTKKLLGRLFKAVPGKGTVKAAVRSVGKVARNPLKAAGKVGSSAMKTTRAATRRVRKLIKY